MQKIFVAKLLFLTSLVFACGNETPEVSSTTTLGNNLYADFSDQDLSGQNLSGILLTGSNFTNSNLSGADLSDSDLGGATLIKANLTGAILRNANLASANLEQADLNGSDLSHSFAMGASFENADLSLANLEEADFSGTNLTSAILEKTNLKNTILNQARQNDSTRWPDQFYPESQGVVDEQYFYLGGGNNFLFQHDLDGNWDISIMESDGKNVRELTNDDIYNYKPKMSPDGEKFVFVRNSGKNSSGEIFLYDLKTGEFENLTNNDLRNNNPRWSPDGRKISYEQWESTSEEYSPGSLNFMDVDGSNKQKLDLDITVIDHSWSPDGQKIIFTSQGEIETEEGPYSGRFAFLVNPDGSDLRQLDFEEGAIRVEEPVFSPDGRQIAYTCFYKGMQPQICITNPKTGEDVFLTEGFPGSSTYPTWSPDSNWIVFRNIRNGVGHMVQMRTDKSEIINMEVLGAPSSWTD